MHSSRVSLFFLLISLFFLLLFISSMESKLTKATVKKVAKTGFKVAKVLVKVAHHSSGGHKQRHRSKNHGTNLNSNSNSTEVSSEEEGQETNVENIQYVEANGTLLCNGKPMEGVLVKLYDIDHVLDDLLDSNNTDAQGNFALFGGTVEGSAIEPKLNFYHDCADNAPCQRKFSILIPAEFIARGNSYNNESSQVFQAGTIELSGRRPNEERDCLH